jgi:CubicO group peptidase (beta-lactamase class C family)
MTRLAVGSIALALASLFVGLRPTVDPKTVDTIVRETMNAWQVPGVAVAIVRDDQITYLKGHGVRERGSEEAVTPDTLFPIASCTKAFTTTALAMLADEGKMEWDDPVKDHLKWFKLSDPLADAQVTMRDLLTHRTGLGSHDLLWYRSPWERDEIIRRIGKARPKHPFRSTFQYQSTMFAAAGAALEAISTKKWDEFVQKRIFDPLGMTASCFTTAAAEQAPDRARPHRKDARGTPTAVAPYVLTKPDPAGSIHSTARDLSHWARFQLGDGTFDGKRLVSMKNLMETRSPQMVIRLEGLARDMNPHTHQMNYGMGWVLQDYRGHFLVSHAGAIDGFRAHITLVPDAKLGIVILSNLHQTQMNIALSNQLVDLLLDLPKKDWNSYIAEQVRKHEEANLARLREREARRRQGTRPTAETPKYVGTYEDPAYGTAEVTLVNGHLVWKWNSFSGELDHYHNDVFTVRNETIGFPRAVFTFGRDGEVMAMRFIDVLEAEFQKVKPPGKDLR